MWKGRRGTSTHVRSAPATAAAFCARPRCVLLCSARAQSDHRTHAAHTAKVRFPRTPALVLSNFCPCPATCIFERTEINIDTTLCRTIILSQLQTIFQRLVRTTPRPQQGQGHHVSAIFKGSNSNTLFKGGQLTAMM